MTPNHPMQKAVMGTAVVDEKRLARVTAKLWSHTTVDPSGCWLWNGYITPSGYGWTQVDGRKIGAHRLALLAASVEVPVGMDVCHRCDVRNCINPDHLYVGTRRQNMADCTERRRHNKPVGEAHWCAKLPASSVIEIRQRRHAGETVTSLAMSFGVHHSTISRIARREWRKEVA